MAPARLERSSSRGRSWRGVRQAAPAVRHPRVREEGIFPRCVRCCGLKLNKRKEQTAVSQRLVPFLFCVSLLCSHTFFSKFIRLRERHIVWVVFHRRELLVNLLNESYCCRTSCKHPHKIVSLLYKNGTNYYTIQQLLFVRDKINQVCLLVREVDVHYKYSWYFFGLRMHAMTAVS